MNKNWIQIRRDLYQKVRDQVELKLGLNYAEIRKYQSAYEKEFLRPWRSISSAQLFQKIAAVDVVFLADFHALQQSQKSHLRILRKMDASRAVLLVECLASKDQKHIDLFMKGQITEKAFLEAVSWQKNWSFPWLFYKPLFKWAMSNQVPVYGLNKMIKTKGTKSLEQRDAHAAEVILKLQAKYPKCKLFVQYGDLHIAENKLPRLLRANRKIKYLKIHQNSEKLYFELLNQGLESQVDLIELDAKTVCLMSVPPWVKWQNYLFYLEHYADGFLRGKKSSEGIDYTDHVAAFVQLLAAELQLPVTTSNLSVFTADDKKIWQLLGAQCKKSELAIYQFMIEEGVSFYFPRGGFGFLARPTVNHAAQLGTHYILAELGKRSHSLVNFPDDFMPLIWTEGLIYFGTKLMNHRRKTDTIFDIKTALSSSKSHEFGKEALLLALSQKTKELLVLAGKVNARLSYRPRRKKSYLIAARLLGGLIGEKLYNGFRKKRIGLGTVQKYFYEDSTSAEFHKSYFAMLKAVEALPLHFKSKNERL